MSQNIKIGDKTYNGVKYISCACADHEGEQRRFIDEMSIPENKLAKLIGGTEYVALTAEDLAGCAEIRNGAFYTCYKLTSVVIPDSVTQIGTRAFYYCSNLVSIVIPDSVTQIFEQVFYYCSVLTSVVIPNGNTRIYNETFYHCERLTSVVIPNGVTLIGFNAFEYCNALTSIEIPSSVTGIAAAALRIGSTTNKATITLKGTTPPSIWSDTFDATKLAKIIVPAGCGDAYKAATNWAAFADYIEEATA